MASAVTFLSGPCALAATGEESAPTQDNSQATIQPGLPTEAALKARLEGIADDDRLDEDQKAGWSAEFERALSQLDELERIRAQAKKLEQGRENAPSRREELQAALLTPKSPNLPANLSSADLDALESFRSTEALALSDVRRQISAIEQQLKNETSFDSEKALAEALELTLDPPPIGSESDTRMVGIIEDALRLAKVDLLEQRRVGKDARLSLLKLEQQVLNQKASAAQSRIEKILVLIGDNQIFDAQKELKNAEDALTAAQGKADPLVSAASDNVEMATKLIEVVRQQGIVNKQASSEERKVRVLQERFGSLTTQLQLFQIGSSHEFGAALRQQRDQLTDTNDSIAQQETLESQLSAFRLAQFQHDNKSNEFADSDSQQIVQQTGRVGELVIEQHLRLVGKLDSGYTRLIDDLSRAFQQVQAQITQSQSYSALLDQHLLWIRSSEAVGPQTLTNARQALGELQDINFLSQLRDVISKRLPVVILSGSLLILLSVGILMYRGRLVSELSAMTEVVGRVHKDSFSVTAKAFGITILLALPGPAIMAGLSAPFLTSSGAVRALGTALLYGSSVYLALTLLLQTVRRDGLGPVHYKWAPETTLTLRRNLIWFIPPFVVAIAANFFLEQFGSSAVHDSLGRVAFIVATLLLAVFAYKTLNPTAGLLRAKNTKNSGKSPWQVRYLLFPLVVFLPATVAILSLFGYHYSAVQLDAHLLRSMAVGLAGLTVYFLAARASAISERRLTLERVQAKRAAALENVDDRDAALAAGEGVPSADDIQKIDIQAVSDQTKVLIKLLVTTGVAIALWNIWSDLLPAFQSLDSVELWDVSKVVDGIPIAASITLWDITLAILVALVTFLSAKNIPGSLEVALLSRMNLETGTSYAVTTIMRYLILIIGSVVVLQYLGAQWSKLQWLVAALSVGLGFGLQEIVANFVSGIVLLFERPIRIGDTVTVGDKMGTVSQIQIRATTIVDWDRREVIIPNKTFITEQLVNWTLTDPITRVIVPVGVAYGSDVDLVEKLLLEVAKESDLVLRDPPSAAMFLSFGESSLDFELRVFIQGVRDFNLVKHHAHHAIDKKFREAGIEIPFPQRDLNFDSKDLELKLPTGSEKGIEHDAQDEDEDAR